ncbi:MAG: hypothetical protein Q4G05_04400 [Clostridia bacterium]|nr:hypothetical protein [Clostridia bacterium]
MVKLKELLSISNPLVCKFFESENVDLDDFFLGVFDDSTSLEDINLFLNQVIYFLPNGNTTFFLKLFPTFKNFLSFINDLTYPINITQINNSTFKIIDATNNELYLILRNSLKSENMLFMVSSPDGGLMNLLDIKKNEESGNYLLDFYITVPSYSLNVKSQLDSSKLSNIISRIGKIQIKSCKMETIVSKLTDYFICMKVEKTTYNIKANKHTLKSYV